MVWNSFWQAQESVRHEIGMVGNRLKRIRERADYDDFVPGLGDAADDVIETTKELMGALKNLNTGRR